MPTKEKILISEWEHQATKSSHTNHAIVNPPETHDKPSNYNDEVCKRKSLRKRKSLSDGIDKEMESAPKKKHVHKSFAQRIENLRVYKEKHGHINVKKSEDKSLYEFCISMRCARKKPEKSAMTITDYRIASLDGHQSGGALHNE